jgi:lysophospholipase L1-like esterase
MSSKSDMPNISVHKRLLSLHHSVAALAEVLFTVIFFTYCSPSQFVTSKPSKVWIGTWGTAPQLVEPRNLPPEPGLSDNTLRQIVRVSLGGDSLKVRFSNEFGTSPVTMKAVHFAASMDNSAINPETDKALLFDGEPQVTIAPGASIISDPFRFALAPRSNVAITMHFGATSPDVTGHPGSRTTSYLLPGNEVSAADLAAAVQTDHWYIINGIDVVAPESAAAVVVLGNSITDGRGSGTNRQNRWPDELARRLQENPATRQVAVLNQGIGGNCVLRDCLGPAALSRFERDVIRQNGVRWLIILEGINDIGQAQGSDGSAKVAADLIAAYIQMIDAAHAKGIRVYGATLLPFGGSFYDTADHESARKTVNEWIRNSGRFDAVIDLDSALGDPANPLQLLPAADTGDHLHPNEIGHRMMAEAVDIGLFK